MWKAINGMSKEFQDLAKGDANTNGEEDAEMVLVSNNLVEERLVLEVVASVTPQPMQ